MRTFGVEEELLLIDPSAGAPVAVAPLILGRPSAEQGFALEAEMQQEMLEVVSPPCRTADELTEVVTQGRRAADARASEFGARAVPLATSPVGCTPHASSSPRYQQMIARYGTTARHSFTCGLHVHVAVESAEEGVGVLDRIREWLPSILALSANSPFWKGTDTGYASYRYDVWSRWPSAGPSPVFGSETAYREHERVLLATDILLDAGMLYFDARLSRNHPTVEIRVADVCLREEDTVTVAVLCRALVETAAAEWRLGRPPLGSPERLLRLASWRSALTGMRGDHVDLLTGEPRTARQAIDALLSHVEPGLSLFGDLARARAGAEAILRRGTGADWQRARFERRGRMEDVVAAAWARQPLESPQAQVELAAS
ncbi:glutamate--cysteine ligase [Microbacterium sp. 179-I 3D4 NHS]|uniref:carboxylate-amine ligase n=1 Tax=Microbacterium sp. 179-I 3D4 NHS TaxID=3142381 RepID=UPI00399F9A05